LKSALLDKTEPELIAFNALILTLSASPIFILPLYNNTAIPLPNTKSLSLTVTVATSIFAVLISITLSENVFEDKISFNEGFEVDVYFLSSSLSSISTNDTLNVKLSPFNTESSSISTVKGNSNLPFTKSISSK
jgi:hypothetical protein